MTTLSLCMIVKDEAHNIKNCLNSVKDYVQQIVIVDTGSTDGTQEEARKLGAEVYDFTPTTNPDCFITDDNSTGVPGPYTNKKFLGNFSAARNYSFSKAKCDYVLWLDADDVVEGADQLPNIVVELAKDQSLAAWFRYDYSMGGDCSLWRERISKRGVGKWVNPIHELLDLPGTRERRFGSVVVKHRRELHKTQSLAHRNLKVLKKNNPNILEQANPDARTLFYLGNEAKYVNPQEAIEYYQKYLRISGWEEERGVARLYLGRMYEDKGDLEGAMQSYASAVVDCPTNPDPLFRIARLLYVKGQHHRCCEYAERGFALGSPPSVIMYNPLERSYYPHQFYNVALNAIGRVHAALASCEAGLAANASDSNLKFNRDVYAKFLAENPSFKDPETTASAWTVGDAMQGRGSDYVLPSPVSELVRQAEIEGGLEHALRLARALPQSDQATRLVLDLQQAWENRIHARRTPSPKAAKTVSPSVLCDIPRTSDLLPVFDAVRIHVGSEPRNVLVVGSQDGEISNRLASLGHTVVGVDTNAQNIRSAAGVAASLDLTASYYLCDGSYESASALSRFDTVVVLGALEFCESATRLLRWVSERLIQNGTCVVVTSAQAKPAKGLRAFTQASLKAALSAELDVTHCYSEPVPSVDGASLRVAVGIRRPKSRLEKKLSITVWTGPAYEWWNPITPHTSGTGGSEIACIEMCRNLARLGHAVTVFNDCPHRDGMFDEVEYRHFGHLKGSPAETCDVFICSRQPHAILNHSIKAKAKFLWVHDIHCGTPDAAMHEALLKFDYFLTLSTWHKQFMLNTYPWLDKTRVLVTRNGINLDRFAGASASPRTNKLIYASSGNRGLDTLLRLFPSIRTQVPNATLDVFYGFDGWRAAARGNAEELRRIDDLERLAKATKGVSLRGRVSQAQLAAEWKTAKVWAYPTEFWETFGITAIEAQAGGAIPVTSRLAGLIDTVGSGTMLAPKHENKSYDQEFVSGVVKALTDNEFFQEQSRRGKEFASGFSWADLATDWELMFYAAIAETKSGSIHNYEVVR